MKSSALPVV
jgi:hypothetical protein